MVKNCKRMLFSAFSLVVLASAVFFSCTRSNTVQSITEDDLFTLNYGNFEDQLNMFSITKVGSIRTAMTMRDGFFYIANGEAGKIMSFNSFGDLLSLYYNEDAFNNNASAVSEKTASNIWKPVAYPFNFNGKIAVDSRKYMYAVGTVPKERNEQDEEANLLYNNVVLRFSSDGTVIDYIGQHGPSGTPFPYIRDIYTTAKDELVVVCTTNTGSCVYWFAANGFLMYKIPVNTQDAPLLSPLVLASSGTDVSATVENIIPDYSARRLYVKIDYYSSYVDKESKVQSGINYLETLVYPLNVETGLYEEPVNIPPFEESVIEDFSKLTYKLPYDFLGTTKSGWQFFIIATQSGFNVEMIQPGTQRVLRRHFDVDHHEVMYYSLSLSDGGIISALLIGKKSARVVWWRTDSLIESILKS